MKFTHEKETHSFECCESFPEGFEIISSNTKKKKANDICIRHLAISCCMLVCFMAMAHKRICNTIEMWKQFAKFKENSLDICGHVLPFISSPNAISLRSLFL
jgi:hypothetical protein